MTDPLSRARRVESPDVRSLYARWAADYDRDVFERMGVTGSARIAELLAEHVADRTTPVVDVGCGTGAVGVRLAALGFGDLSGFDISSEMVDLARSTGVYRRLVVADLSAPPVTDRRFGASVSAGTFVEGHLGAGAVAGLLGMLRPASTIAWTVTPALWPPVARALEASDVTIVRDDHEPIRASGDDRAHFVVGVVGGG